MPKSLLSLTAVALAFAVPSLAAAQSAPAGDGSCPPGSWFCTEAPQLRAQPAGQPVQPSAPPLEALPPPSMSSADQEPEPAPAPPPPRARRRRSAPRTLPPPAVIYEPPPPVMLERPGPPPPYEYFRPRREPLSPPHEFGLNMHFEGAMIGSGAQGNTGMGGLGAGLRFKPSRSFGIEGDLDFAGGSHDYQGNKRNETALMLNALLFLNPRSHAQVYLLAGMGWSGAHVTCDTCATPVESHYDYFGGQIGAGLELRLTRVLAFNLDLRGFVRGRTDGLAQVQPEFDKPAGCSSNPSFAGTCRTTNSSGGALLTAGMTLYF
jgi:hypothetical protein